MFTQVRIYKRILNLDTFIIFSLATYNMHQTKGTARQANMYITRVSSMDFFSLIRRVQKNTYCLTTRIHSGRTVRAVRPNTILLLSVFILDCWVCRGREGGGGQLLSENRDECLDIYNFFRVTKSVGEM
jgi:hypothetical protein